MTATADLRMEEGIEHGSRHWTGVWSNAAADNASQEIYTRTPELKFEGWLVSGERELLSNEDSTTLSLGSGITLGNPLFPFPGRLPSVFIALGEKANS